MPIAYVHSPDRPGITFRVEFIDVAGGYGGWFLLHMGPPFDDADPIDHNPDNGPYMLGVLSNPGPLRDLFAAAVALRLSAMFGAGHSARWSATLVQSVAPAVIDDDWPAL